MSLGIDPHELARLVHTALNAPDHVPELRTDTGVTVHVERDPESGIELRLFLADNADWEVLVTHPTETRPAAYPKNIPFVSNATAVVARSEGTIMVTWHQVGDLAGIRQLMAETDGLVDDPAIREAQQRVRMLLDPAREGDVAARGALKDEAALVRAAISPETREKLRELWEQLQPGTDRLIELERIFRAAVASTEAAGWKRTFQDHPESGSPFGARSVTYRLGDSQRSIALVAAFGPVSSVTLQEAPAPMV